MVIRRRNLVSQISMTIADSRRAIHGQPHGSFVDFVLAALTAEPDSIEELEEALKRFPDRADEMRCWSSGSCEEPYDAGICIVDLAARLVVCESTYCSPGPEGEVCLRRPNRDSDASIRYHLSDDWHFSSDLEAWSWLSESRRAQRAATPPLDARAVLYGQVCTFIVDECFAARGQNTAAGDWSPPEGWSLEALPERAKPGEPLTAGDAIAEIHARWLMRPRGDLRGRSPREVLLGKQDVIGWDLQSRCEQWSLMGECLPGLSKDSAAYRFGGFGMHENVVYYDLVRHLICECWDRVVEPADPASERPGKADELRGLEQAKDRWLAEPNFEDLSGQTPGEVIERERMRLPWAVSAEEAMVDDDCPLCQMLGEGGGPVFWNLDGCNRDFDFPFSFELDRAAWEEEQRRYEESARRYEEERERRRAAGLPEEDALPWDDTPGASIWKTSFSQVDPQVDPPQIVLFGIGSHLAELGQDLKASPETAELAASLNRQFGNVQAALEDPTAALVEPVVSKFCQELQSVAELRPELAEKCADLEDMLQQLAARLVDEPDDAPELPPDDDPL